MEKAPWKSISQKVKNFELKKGITSFVNPYSMLLLKDETGIVEGVNQWCIDGISFVKIFNASFKKNISRYSFDDTSVASIVFPVAKRDNLKVAIVGTEERYIKTAVSNIEEKYNIKVSLYRNGYFNSPEERSQYLKQLLDSKVDMVICGMGTPHQENFLIDLRNIGWDGYGFTCGGYLHQIAKKKNYYPPMIDKLNLRWVYRIVDEPKLFKRYLLNYPLFFLVFFLSIKSFASPDYPKKQPIDWEL
ncbi:WecB/TagA/CpsF family glycosyltransferase [Pontibacter locisalis]|uniref:WecB/TagA/CpsF family glycosyltransferase n=1 Tax=Pontibacter locisalis TaxID=1719035 RepID=A0ABW5IK00_9BACT